MPQSRGCGCCLVIIEMQLRNLRMIVIFGASSLVVGVVIG